jgi:hypothetical protein
MALKAKATQEFVPIKEVRDGVVVLKDGGLRAVLMASSINLSLKSADEQEAILLQFQNFLNSLDFSTQIVIQSRRLDIRPYLLLLENRLKEQLEPLLKVQTKEYMDFIRGFTEQVNIMTKSFFIVVPYSATTLKNGSPLSSILPSFGGGDKSEQKKDASLEFEEKRSQLDQRVSVIIQGLQRVGVRATQLGTEEVIELFYKTFNPGDISQGIKLQ